MSQHFLLSSKARDLSIIKIAAMSDDEVEEIFKKRKVGQKGEKWRV